MIDKNDCTGKENKDRRRYVMSMPILRKEDVIYREDPINMETGLNKSVVEEDNRIEEENGLIGRIENNGGHKKDIRDMIIDFVKSEGYSHTEGDKDFDDETNDLFAKDDILVQMTITTGIDETVIRQIMEGDAEKYN